MTPNLKKGASMAERLKYYSHMFMSDKDGSNIILPVYEFWQTETPALKQPRYHGIREMVHLDDEDALTEWIEQHPDYQEAPPEAWEQANWNPYGRSIRFYPIRRGRDKS